MEWPLFTGLGPVGALPTAARLARAFTLAIVADWGLACLADDCELVIGELVANVVQAATAADGAPWYDDRGRLPLLWVRLLSDGVRLRVEVWDNLPLALGLPEQRRPSRNEESGRGLGIVRELSKDWGWDHIPGQGAKRVWALLEKPGPCAERVPDRAPGGTRATRPHARPARHRVADLHVRPHEKPASQQPL